MNKQDILFNVDEGIFSYRVAGILIRDGKVLLQHPRECKEYAFPGGHVNFSETSEDALIREFSEEIAADIIPERLLWIGENFFSCRNKKWHQICLYYFVTLSDETQTHLSGNFYVQDELAGEKWDLEFSWIDLSSINDIELYPTNAKGKLLHLSEHIEQFVYREGENKLYKNR